MITLIVLNGRQNFGDWQIEAEEGKKENRSKGVFEMTFRDFLSKYQDTDMYLVEDVKPSHKLAGKL